MDKEVREFVESIGAHEPREGDAVYARFRQFFKRLNYFFLNDCLIIVKVSRTEKPFWGVGKKYIDLLNKLSSPYYLVLLTSGRDGWVFDKHDILHNIDMGYWKLSSKDENYKINPPLKDRNSFTSPKRFFEIIRMPS